MIEEVARLNVCEPGVKLLEQVLGIADELRRQTVVWRTVAIQLHEPEHVNDHVLRQVFDDAVQRLPLILDCVDCRHRNPSIRNLRHACCVV